MPLRVERRDGTDERSVLTGMLVSRRVLGAVADKWEPGLFTSRVGSLVGGWAIEHYRKYHKPPGRAVENYFSRWSEGAADKDTIRMVESFLAGLSEEYENLKRTTSPEYIIDAAARLFNRNRASELRDGLEGDLETGDVEKALSRVESFRKLELGTGSGIAPGRDREAVEAALEDRVTEPLIPYPEALANFFGASLGRGNFLAFLAKEKGGKSFWLLDAAYRCARAGFNAAYFDTGDNTQHQVMRRLMARAAGRPVEAGKYPFPVSLETPEPGRGKSAVPEHETRRADGRMTPDEGQNALAVLGDRFRLSCHPNNTLSVNGADSVLTEWERDGFVPDAIFFDYADIMAPIDPRAERRDQINDTWMAMRSLSQSRHCLVMTATQANAKSYDAWLLRRANFAEDKRKFAHVTGFCGINQTSGEHDVQLFRLNWLFLRDLAFSEEKCVHIAASLACASPAVLATF